jgi:hypothetical protein
MMQDEDQREPLPRRLARRPIETAPPVAAPIKTRQTVADLRAVYESIARDCTKAKTVGDARYAELRKQKTAAFRAWHEAATAEEKAAKARPIVARGTLPGLIPPSIPSPWL